MADATPVSESSGDSRHRISSPSRHLDAIAGVATLPSHHDRALDALRKPVTGRPSANRLSAHCIITGSVVRMTSERVRRVTVWRALKAPRMTFVLVVANQKEPVNGLWQTAKAAIRRHPIEE